jgi:hypothetical protein
MSRDIHIAGQTSPQSVAIPSGEQVEGAARKRVYPRHRHRVGGARCLSSILLYLPNEQT